MDPLQKCTPTPSDGGIICKFRPRCCTVNPFKRVGVLLIFHLLNVLMAIGGVISVVILLGSMILMPLWVVALLLVALAMFMIHVVQQIPQKSLMYVGYVVLAALYIAFLSINWYITVGPYALFAAGAVGVGLFFLSAATVKLLVKLDVQLAKFVSTDEADALQPDECTYRFKLSKQPTPACGCSHCGSANAGAFQWIRFRKLSHVWQHPHRVSWLDHLNLVDWSRRSAYRGSAVRETNVTEAIPVTPEPESSATSFAELGTSTPVAPSAAVTVV
ncbi:hypothetical protein GQ600_14459 [Phytophthora cactorum]|nr:hypothetical protein GQ600_14459 [Phytophthora cactorum]